MAPTSDDFARLFGAGGREPELPEFVQLGERLRRRGDLGSAARVAVAGLQRFPEHPDGHDLYARILADQGDFEAAEEEWLLALEYAPRHLGALKGLGYLRYRAGDLDGALEYLETALAVNPTDPTVVRALQTVRGAAERSVLPEVPEATGSVFAGLEGADEGIVLADARGRVLGGRLQGAGQQDRTEVMAGYLALAAQEAERTSRRLGLGTWEWVIAEGASGNLYATPPGDGTVLAIVRDRGLPAGRLALLAERASALARDWLRRQRL